MKNKLLNILLGLIVLLHAGVVCSQDTKSITAINWITFKTTGDFVIGKSITGAVSQYSEKGKMQSQNWNSVKVRSKDRSNIEGTFSTQDGKIFKLNEKLKVISDNEFSYSVNLSNTEGIDCSLLCLNLRLNVADYAGKEISIDEKEIILPAEFGKMAVFSSNNAKEIKIKLSDGYLILKGDLNCSVLDGRKFNSDSYIIRILFDPYKGKITASSLNLTFTKESFQVNPVDLSAAANMGFKDDAADDQKGGWTDQGPNNDLRMFKSGTRILGGVTFDIIDPDKNNGKSCVMMAGKSRKYFAESFTVPMQNQTDNYLYLLHSLAWKPQDGTKIGDITATYGDNSKDTFPIISGIDVADWWSPYSRKNAAVCWTGENQNSYVGLYVTSLKLSGKPLKSIDVKSAQTGVWGIVGMSTSLDKIECDKANPPTYIVADKNWVVFDQSKEIETGTALDFSFLQDAPAGKYGRVVSSNGHFEFVNGKGKTARFYGTNLSFKTNFLSREDCEALADTLSKIGYNSIRIHHYEGDLVEKKDMDSTNPDKVQLDKLDYLFYCMKKKGIYVTTDLYVSRPLSKNEIPEYPVTSKKELKALIPLFQSARDNWKQFTKKLLTHKNPYTGMTWAEDPALFSISLVNENSVYACWDASPQIKKIYLQRFEEWLKTKKINNLSEIAKDKLLHIFLTELQVASQKEQVAYIRELGCKALLTDVNWHNETYMSIIRDQFDSVDNHCYFDHPSSIVGSYELPLKYQNRSVLALGAKVPRIAMPTRIFGKPFMLTEFNYCFPNNFRAEGGAVMGAYAALQGWSGLYRFDYSFSDKLVKREKAAVHTRFDTDYDPISLLSEKIGLLLFLRGDVKEADQTVPFVFSDDYISKLNTMDGKYPKDYDYLGLSRKIGSINLKNIDSVTLDNPQMFVGDVNLNNSKIQQWNPELLKNNFVGKKFDFENGIFQSINGQISLNEKKQTFKVISPKTEALIVSGRNQIAGNILKVNNDDGFTVVCLSSLDGLELEKSKHMLLLHLTDIQNNKIKFRDKQRTIMEKWGELPLLLRKGTATASLTLKGDYTVQALHLNGKPAMDIPLTPTTDGFSLVMDNIKNKNAMAYQIIKK